MFTPILDRFENSEVQYNIIDGNYVSILDFDNKSPMGFKVVFS